MQNINFKQMYQLIALQVNLTICNPRLFVRILSTLSDISLRINYDTEPVRSITNIKEIGGIHHCYEDIDIIMPFQINLFSNNFV